MEIVIKIDENVFTRLFDNGTEDYAIVNDDLFAIARSIRNGKPLPEHGDLIDRQALIDNGIKKGFCNWYDEIKYAPTIIEADKENE